MVVGVEPEAEPVLPAEACVGEGMAERDGEAEKSEALAALPPPPPAVLALAGEMEPLSLLLLPISAALLVLIEGAARGCRAGLG